MQPLNLNIYYQNCRGLRTKMTQFRQNILGNSYDLIIITETWLHGGIFDSEFCDPRYDVFRKDRDLAATGKSSGGGVMILARHDLGTWCNECEPNTIGTELLTIIIPGRALSASGNLYVSVVYVPPDAHRIAADVNYVLQSVANSLSHKTKDNNYILIGDFNLPCIKWNVGGPTFLKQGTIEVQNAGMRLVNDLCFLGLTQYNTLSNHKGHTLDLAFSNLLLHINECIHPLTKVDNHHPVLSIEIPDLEISPFRELSAPRRNYRKTDYNALNNYFAKIDWHSSFDKKSTDSAVHGFYEVIQTGIDEHVPLSRLVGSRRYPIWYSNSLIKIIKQKSRAHSRWKRFGNLLDRDEFAMLRDRQRHVQKLCYSKYLHETENDLKENPKKFWTYIKNLRGGSSYPKMLSRNNVNYTDGKDICEAFGDFFHDVFGEPSDYNQAGVGDTEVEDGCVDIITDLEFTPSTVEKSLSSLGTDKGPGCDGIPPLFWKGCAKSLAHPISFIFNLSLREGTFPNEWKKALIIPIHKKGSRIKIENYRGISILNTLGKVFEKLVYNAIYNYILRGISYKQHGFLKKRSSVSNLACFSNFILENTENGGQVDVIYTDFEKAFDRVDHSILLSKLYRLGIRGDLLRWVKSYLFKRSQAVVLGGFRSNFIEIPSGVPQGSHLGPLFYNAYLFDITDSFKHSEHLMYADDKKIFYKITSADDCTALQQDLNSLHDYYTRNKITVNVTKCQCISYTRKKNPITYSYKFNAITIDKVEIVRDLGVMFDSKLTFSNHIDLITSKAYKSLGFVLRSCKAFKNIEALKSVYFAYVRSVLEYACPIWSPQYIIYKNKIERVQKKFINHLNYRLRKPPMSYENSCRIHGLLTLEERRKMLDMCVLYDILNGRLDCPDLLSQIKFNAPLRRTRHTPMLHVPRHATNYASNCVLARIARSYNNDFSQVDVFNCTKPSFKAQVKKIIVNKND